MPEVHPAADSPVTPDISDAELLQRVAQQDEAALAELFKRFHPRVLSLAIRYLHDRGDAELITQDTFLKIWTHARTFRGSSQVWTWIYRIAVNLCLTFKIRKRLPTTSLDESIPTDPNAEPDRNFNRRELEGIVDAALATLPEDQRMAVILCRYEGMSYDEIGEAMNRSKTAVATLLFRAKENLQTKLRPLMLRGKITP